MSGFQFSNSLARWINRLLAVTTMAALCACQTVQTTQGGVVGVERSQRMAISAQQVEQSSAKEYRQMMAQEAQRGRLNRQAGQVDRVRNIANRLIVQTVAFRADAPGWQWEINLISAGDVNAWCMPGGKIAVYTGLIEKLQVTDDELTAVIGHEIAHALREHARERMSEQMGTNLAATGVDLLGALYGVKGLGKVAAQSLQLVVNLPHSREQETEADRIGVELAARAGFLPSAAVSLWQKMARVGNQEPMKFLSTHPSRAEREHDLAEMSRRVMPLYERAQHK
nr:Putative Peptidase M48 [uncultured bacterium]